MRTRQQERMRDSLNQIREAGKQPKEVADYGRACLNFPVLVRTAGLCQAVAFFGSRTAGHRRYLGDLRKQLQASGLFKKDEQLLDGLTEADLIHYMLLTRESLAIADWLKRFAQSELGADPTQDKEG